MRVELECKVSPPWSFKKYFDIIRVKNGDAFDSIPITTENLFYSIIF